MNERSDAFPAQSEAHPELEPVFVLQSLPGADTLVVNVFRVGVEDGGGACGGKALEGQVFQTENLLVEAFFGGLPGEGGQLVGAAELPQVTVRHVLFLAANFKVPGEGGGAAEYGNTGALAGIIDRNPAYAAHCIREPAAELGDVAVGAPGHGYGPAEFHGPRGEGVEGVAQGGGKPGVGHGAHHGIGRMLPGGGARQLDVPGHVKVRSLVGFPVEGHHFADVHLFVRFHGEGELVHVIREAQRRG